MNTLKYIITVVICSFILSCTAQIKNQKIEHVKIDGNCGMCKSTIEKAGNIKMITNVDWNQKTKEAVITYDSTKTDRNEILKRIALAGYDNKEFRAPDDIYAQLHGCCQYERSPKINDQSNNAPVDMDKAHNNHNHSGTQHSTTADAQDVSPLKAVFDNYFTLKDALVQTDVPSSSTHAAKLLNVVKAVKMDKLATEEHTVWMKELKNILSEASNIAAAKEVDQQREHFAVLSKSIYALAKVHKQNAPIYYQHCPMYNNGKGANWLSKESAIKNPYYGSQMLTCGKTVETIQ